MKLLPTLALCAAAVSAAPDASAKADPYVLYRGFGFYGAPVYGGYYGGYASPYYGYG